MSHGTRVGAGQVVELVEDRREEEPRQEQGRHDELDVAEDGVERREREREARDEDDDHGRDGDRSPGDVAALGPEPQRQAEHDRRHGGEGHHLGRDHRQGDELAREPDLADDRGVLDDAPRPALQRRREEDPRRKAAEQEQPVVVRLGRLRLPEHREDDEVHEHERGRQRERPREPEERSLVLRAEIAAEEAAEQLAVAEQVGIDAHRARL